ncbi:MULTISPECIES: hypothetical protein [unclassified Sulfuricurvum]|uniref:hypothetical protein n=1 Tax=unclassified Sulfuricurvum TaxID=2632390 RepID=UPI0002996B87|nr:MULTISPECIES: hypothetical protein [unclassified Sulfuricurvum]AFV96927.1 hypothetical protein B649_03065 [Candidatus Sulfuricurvum sp. RIFRC-1]OHD79744.1 MAG: hypothetical protein A3D90_03915 [Sulfuricurvum sp. RIFCSPHIGHO2_02_FULL_43_9]OHD87826.1 MAG: hypothetical protein A2Y52_06490 [Sulfuricurvum sp. RIFCSPLOWO2_02_43_6]HBM35088.1 hypothetical protein [Sulfuricurvum sp.]
MFFSFLTRIFSSKPKEPILNDPEDNIPLKIFVIKEGGKFFHDFQLFHQNSITSIDTLIFLPHYGIFFGKTLEWKASELENATVERSSKQSKRTTATNLEGVEAKIRSKLEDVLSFNFTPVERFIWMKHLSEIEFDALDPSFHELLPKERIFFTNETVESIRTKLDSIGEYHSSPLSSVQIIGALATHTFILPTPDYPAGSILSPQQNHFLILPLQGTTTLYGDYGSGKSLLLIRKAILMLLTNPEEKIVLLAPTLLASELLRDGFVSLMYYGALNIDLNRIIFSHLPEEFDNLKMYQDATAIFCDDSYLMDGRFINALKQKMVNKILLFSSIAENPDSQTNIHLTYGYRNKPSHTTLACTEKGVLPALLSELRKYRANKGKGVILILSDAAFIPLYKEPIDEYLGINSRSLTVNFSLQYQDMEGLIITTADCLSGVSGSHVLLLTSEVSEDYTYPLSRASETATIITYSNS